MKEQNTKEPKRENITVMIFFLLCMQMDRKIIAVIAVSISPETYGLGGIRRLGEGGMMKMHSHWELWPRAFVLSVP